MKPIFWESCGALRRIMCLHIKRREQERSGRPSVLVYVMDSQITGNDGRYINVSINRGMYSVSN